MKHIISRLKYYYDRLGPGFITGAADDDPSGIATYSIAGAQFGYKLTWLNLFLVPLVYSIQEMCGRIGMVSGMGLAGCIKKYYPRKLLLFTITILIVANTINIGSDLGAMAASLQMLLPIPYFIWLIIITIITILLEVFVPYDKYSRYLKWMALTLLVYGFTAFLVKQDWLLILRYLVIPHIEFNRTFIMTMVAFVGTTISPYLFFWQTSEQVEEHIKEGKIQDFDESPIVVASEIKIMQKDTKTGMIFACMMSFFIVITTAGTLHASGIVDIETPQQAAMALQPLAGDFAYILFTFGIICIGFQAVPILAGGAAYAFAESFGFKEGLAKKLTEAKAFYATIAAATMIGALMNIIGINPIKALFYTAILNGIVAVPLIAIIIKLANDERIIGNFKSTKINKSLSWFTFFFMGVGALLLIFDFIRGK